MFHPARLNRASVESCRLPLGMPRRSLLATGHLRCIRSRERLRETADRALMAHQSVAFHLYAKQQRIVVAVRGRSHNAQAVTACLAFHPELLSCAAPERDESSLQGFGIALRIQKAQHQDLAGSCILHDTRDKAVHLLEIDLRLSAHILPVFENFCCTNKKPVGLAAGGLRYSLISLAV